MCAVFSCVQTMCVGCQCLGFLTCAQMLMHAIAHGDCTDTVRESALKVDSGRKTHCRTHAHMHARTHARTHAHTHTHTQSNHTRRRPNRNKLARKDGIQSVTVSKPGGAPFHFSVALRPCTETTRLIRDGEPRTTTSTFTQLLSWLSVALRPQKP